MHKIAINRALLDEAHLTWGHRTESKGGQRVERGGAYAYSETTVRTRASQRRMEDKPDGRGSNDRDAKRPLSGEV